MLEKDLKGLDGSNWTARHMSNNYTEKQVGKPSSQFEVAVKKLQRNEPLDEEDKPHVKMLLEKKGDNNDDSDEEKEEKQQDDSSEEEEMMCPRKKRR